MVRYGLIGKHLSHSYSPQHFAALFAQEGLDDHRYEVYELDRIEALPALLAGTPGLRGLNVTIPYKQAVIPYLHDLSATARAVGAVNTVAIKGGKLMGYNTDVDGFRATLLPLIGEARPRALVLGSGGASRAVVYVLRELGITFRVVSRSRETGDLTWDLLDPALIGVCPLIINTTPLGMHPNETEMPPLPLSAIGPKHCLIDLVYNPERTRFLSSGKAQGARVTNGLVMLQAQADAAWRLWRSP